MVTAIDTSRHILEMRNSSQRHTRAAAIVAFRAAVTGAQSAVASGAYEQAGELLEPSVEFAETARVEILTGECFARLLQLQQLARDLAENAATHVRHPGRIRTVV